MSELIRAVTEGITTDVIVILVVFAVLVWYSLKFGKGKIISLILSLYIGLLLFLQIGPAFFLNSLELLSNDTTLIVAYVVFVLATHLILRKLIASSFPFSRVSRLFQASLLSISALLLLLAFSYHALPVSNVLVFSDPIRDLFADPLFFFWWLLGPLVILLLVGRE